MVDRLHKILSFLDLSQILIDIAMLVTEQLLLSHFFSEEYFGF